MQSFKLSNSTSQRACVIALSLATALLSACGGGGGGDSPAPAPVPAPPPPAPAPAPSASDFLVSGAIDNSDGSGKKLLIIDPAQPGQVRLSVNLSGTENYRSNNAYTVDPATQNVTILGELMVYYIKDRQVFQVSMRKTDTTVGQRISSMANACKVESEQVLHFGVADAWVTVTDAGPDDNCATTDDNRRAYVRTGTPVGTAETRLPAGVTLVSNGVPSADMASLQYFLAKDTRGGGPKLVLYTPELQPAGDVAGSEGISNFELQFRPTASDLSAYAFADGTLRRFNWSATGATLSSAIYTFKTGHVHSISDANTFFFVDGPEVQRVVGNGSPQLLATFDSTRGSVWAQHKTPTALILSQTGNASTNFRNSVFSLPKAGGTPLTLATESGAVVVGTAGEDLVYLYSTFTATTHTSTIKRVGSNGQGEALITDKANAYPRGVFHGTLSFNNDELAGLVWCERAATEADCSNGSLYQYTTNPATTVRLGQFSHAGATYTSWNPLEDREVMPSFTLDSPLVFVSTAVLPGSTNVENEMYVARPGVADSLVRVTIP